MTQKDVLKVLQETLEEVENRSFSHISEQTTVTDLEVDSVTMMEVIGCLEDDLNIQIPDEKLAGLNTVGDIVAVVRDSLE
ncbi:MAG: phosphopantetheine-binding protein [Myxococcota bacterium]|nr:phosphopantetheine-binding protein [Myxococcota bacterium]